MRIGSYKLFGRKAKPMVQLDMETRAILEEDVWNVHSPLLGGAYKVGDGPVHALPWEAACAREDWAAADRLHCELVAELRRQNKEYHIEILRIMLKPWLTRKFLTIAARARTLFSR